MNDRNGERDLPGPGEARSDSVWSDAGAGNRPDAAASAPDRGRGIGNFIRDLRRNAGVSLRQLADKAGVSNPYLSQVERGLRKPSAEVLQQIASALRVSTPAMYLKAGLLDDDDGPGVLAAIAADPDLTIAQKQTITQIYETFRRENSRKPDDQEET